MTKKNIIASLAFLAGIAVSSPCFASPEVLLLILTQAPSPTTDTGVIAGKGSDVLQHAKMNLNTQIEIEVKKLKNKVLSLLGPDISKATVKETTVPKAETSTSGSSSNVPVLKTVDNLEKPQKVAAAAEKLKVYEGVTMLDQKYQNDLTNYNLQKATQEAAGRVMYFKYLTAELQKTMDELVKATSTKDRAGDVALNAQHYDVVNRLLILEKQVLYADEAYASFSGLMSIEPVPAPVLPQGGSS